MLEQYFSESIQLGIAQAAITAVLVLIVVMIARWQQIHLEKETLISLLRGLIQIVAVGSVLLLVFQGPVWVGALILTGMVFAAGLTAARRANGIPKSFLASLYGIAFGAGLVILVMTLVGVIDPALTSLIPVGSMLIANAMNSTALALDRFRNDVMAHSGEIEAGLALGADPRVIVTPYAQSAVHASMIPRIDSIRSLGIVWIPGLMTGMILAGADPVYAAIYQFVIMGMIYAVSGLSSVASILWIRPYIFTEAEQLLLRPGIKESAR